MPRKVNPIPRDYRTATPCLIVSSVENAIDFYARAFQATLLTQTNDPTDSYAIQSTIKIGNSVIILQLESIEFGLLSPISLASSSSQLHLYVQDVDALWDQALGGGAVSLTDLADTYWGDRSGVLLDIFGHRWSLASRIEHVSKEDARKRHAALLEAGKPADFPQLGVSSETDMGFLTSAAHS